MILDIRELCQGSNIVFLDIKNLVFFEVTTHNTTQKLFSKSSLPHQHYHDRLERILECLSADDSVSVVDGDTTYEGNFYQSEPKRRVVYDCRSFGS